jgi:hypothetical protein
MVALNTPTWKTPYMALTMTKSGFTWKDIKSELKELTPDDLLGIIADMSSS